MTWHRFSRAAFRSCVASSTVGPDGHQSPGRRPRQRRGRRRGHSIRQMSQPRQSPTSRRISPTAQIAAFVRTAAEVDFSNAEINSNPESPTITDHAVGPTSAGAGQSETSLVSRIHVLHVHTPCSIAGRRSSPEAPRLMVVEDSESSLVASSHKCRQLAVVLALRYLPTAWFSPAEVAGRARRWRQHGIAQRQPAALASLPGRLAMPAPRRFRRETHGPRGALSRHESTSKGRA